MPGEELRGNALLCRLVRDSLGAVLAKLEDLPLLVGAGPRAALAIKPGHMVDLQKRFRGSYRAHLPDAVQHGVPNRGDAGSFLGSRPNPELAQVERVLCLQRDSIIRIQLDCFLWTAAGRSLLTQILLRTIMSVSGLLVSLDYVRAG